MKTFETPLEMFLDMIKVTSVVNDVKGYSANILRVQEDVIETELWTKDSLSFYSRYNMGMDYFEGEAETHKLPLRGGSQGDYRDEMKQKINNVVDCLTKFPNSKRATITIMNYSTAKHDEDDEMKCVREIHFLIHEGFLCANVMVRAQAVIIFPKNIHFITSLMKHIVKELTPFHNVKLGMIGYHITHLVKDRQ